MSQVLGKPQLEDEDDDEEDELVGLADYGDGPDSSDADPDSGTEEGGERGVPRPSSPRASSARTQSLPSVFSRPRPGQARGPRIWSGSRRAELRGGGGVGRGARGGTASCKMGEPECRRRWGGIGGESREKASGQEERALAGPFQGQYLPHLSSELSAGSGVWGGKGTARLAPGPLPDCCC